MDVDGLVHQRWRDLYTRRGRKRHSAANDLVHMPIGVLVEDDVGEGDAVGRGVYPVHISAVLPEPAADAKSELVRDDRAAHCSTRFVARAAILCRAPLGAKQTRGRREARLIRDESDGTAQGMITQAHGLRPTQNLDTIEIEGERKGHQVRGGTVGWYGRIVHV